MIKVTVWNEYEHERTDSKAMECYPNGIHEYVAGFLGSDDIEVRTAYLEMPEHGISEEILQDTDVLIWWGHRAHNKVSDEAAARVQKHVLSGMGFIALHSAHHSKPFKLLMGTTCNLKWRSADRERLWCVNPTHPIASGVPEYIELEIEEMYGEQFDIPKPDDIIYLGWFGGGEVFRSGCTFTRGNGKIFYFQPGHETYKTYHNEDIQKIIRNAVYWARPSVKRGLIPCPRFESLEKTK